jgi:hypothetical protein
MDEQKRKEFSNVGPLKMASRNVVSTAYSGCTKRSRYALVPFNETAFEMSSKNASEVRF